MTFTRDTAPDDWEDRRVRSASHPGPSEPTLDLALPARDRRRHPVSTADVALLAGVFPRTVQTWRARHKPGTAYPFPPVLDASALPDRASLDPRAVYHDYDEAVTWLRATSRYLVEADEIATMLNLPHPGGVVTLTGLGLLPTPVHVADTPSGKRISRWSEPQVRLRIATEPLLKDLRFGRSTLNEVTAVARERAER